MIQKKTHIRPLSIRETERLSSILRTIPPATAILLLVAFSPYMEQASSVLFFACLFLLAALATFVGEKRLVMALQQAQNKRYTELMEPCRAFLRGELDARVIVAQGRRELTVLAATINHLLDEQQHLLVVQRAASQDMQQQVEDTGQQQVEVQPTRAQPSFPEALESEQQESLPDQDVKEQQHPQADESQQPPSQVSDARPDAAVSPLQVQVRSGDAQELEAQLLQVIETLTPVIDGDLRVKLALSDTLVGVVADTFNSFIEELAQFVKWTRYASQTVSISSRTLLDRTIEAAKDSEGQMHSLARATDTVEEIASCMQHLSDTLHLNVEVSLDVQQSLRIQRQPLVEEDDDQDQSLIDELQRKVEMLGTALTATEELATRAESLIGDLYTIAQQVYQSSAGALKRAKRLGELEALANHWYKVAAAFTLEEEEEIDAAKVQWLL